MQTDINLNPHAQNGQTPNDDNRIMFLTKRICYFARLRPGASHSFADLWLGQISHYHNEVKRAMTNPVLRGGK